MRIARSARTPRRILRLTRLALLALCPAACLTLAQSRPMAPTLAIGQLDQLIAPIASYPDELLPLVFAAATHPLEILEAHQWLRQNRGLQGLALINAAQLKHWDTSVQVLLLLPDVLARMATNIRWTIDLGQASLAQPVDLLNAIQRVRALH